jgi:hypothetical protein
MFFTGLLDHQPKKRMGGAQLDVGLGLRRKQDMKKSKRRKRK